MTREEMKEIIQRIIRKLQESTDGEAPPMACIYGDSCDVTTRYAVDEED